MKFACDHVCERDFIDVISKGPLGRKIILGYLDAFSVIVALQWEGVELISMKKNGCERRKSCCNVI